MGFDSPSHWAILAAVVIVLFGYKKLPDMSRSVGRSLRIFKTELKGMNDDDSARSVETTNAVPVAPVVAPSTAQAEPVTPQGAAPATPVAATPPTPTGTAPDSTVQLSQQMGV